MSEQLYMIQFKIPIREIYQFRRPSKCQYIGYIIHQMMVEGFGPDVISTFSAQENIDTGYMDVLAYSYKSSDELQFNLGMYASPQNPLCQVKIDSKKMPTAFPINTRIRIELQFCPTVVYKGKKDPDPIHGNKIFREIDAFLAQRIDQKNTTHTEVYTDWLKKRLEYPLFKSTQKQEKRLDIQSIRIENHITIDTWKMANNKYLNLPKVTATIAATITDPIHFKVLLEKGLGGQKSLGFGMLLLKRPE